MNPSSPLQSEATSAAVSSIAPGGRLRTLHAPWAWSFAGAVIVGIVIASVFGLSIAGNVVLTALVFGTFMVLVGLAQMLVITSGPGNIDLSVPSVIALACMIGMHAMASSGVIAGFAAAVASGVAVGFANYLLIRTLRIPPIIATLSSSFIVQSVAITQSHGMNAPPAALEAFANGRWLGVPHLALMALMLSVAIAILLHLSVFGRGLSAVGQNPRAAWLAGVGVEKTRCAVYLLSGAITAFTGVLLSAVSGGATLDMGVEYMLISIAVVVIGGTLVTGGRATVTGVWGASMFLFLTNAVLNALGAGAGIRSIAYGVLIIAVVVAAGGRPAR
jgi:ribose transport system permease protein